MSDRCYLVNRKDRTVLFLGEFSGSPRFDKEDKVTVDLWTNSFGPAETFRVPISPHAQFGVPWGLGNGKMNPSWRSWILVTPRSRLQASNRWKSWPLPDLELLATAGQGRLR